MFPVGIMTSSVSVTTLGELGAAFKAARIARGLRLEDLALAAGVGRRFLGNWCFSCRLDQPVQSPRFREPNPSRSAWEGRRRALRGSLLRLGLTGSREGCLTPVS